MSFVEGVEVEKTVAADFVDHGPVNFLTVVNGARTLIDRMHACTGILRVHLIYNTITVNHVVRN
jgi:hypothetical protein